MPVDKEQVAQLTADIDQLYICSQVLRTSAKRKAQVAPTMEQVAAIVEMIANNLSRLKLA